jgi:hypothetical protein
MTELAYGDESISEAIQNGPALMDVVINSGPLPYL